jgi:hypothetical protein
MKLLLLVVALATTSCASRQHVATCSSIPGQNPAHFEAFDKQWGSDTRHSAGYLDAVAQEKAGNCSAVFDYLNPGYRQTEAYSAELRGALRSAYETDLALAPWYYYRYRPYHR